MIYFNEFIESCHINTDEFLIHYCPESLDMNIDDFIKAIRYYKSSFVPAKVPNMDLDNRFVKDEESEKD